MVLAQCKEIVEEDNSASLEDDICAWIDANICNPDLSLNSACDHWGISGKMMGLICKKRYNTTFLQYVRSQQIAKAVTLLQESDASLEEIAHRCGFTNVLTFRRNFKAVMDTNPSDYRQ